MAIDPSAGRRHQQDVIVSSGYDTPDAYNWGEADVDNYIEAYDCRPPPIFIPLITLAEIGVFIYYGLIHAWDTDVYNDVSATSGVPINSPLIYDPRKRHEAWRFLTYMFIHNGYIHLAFNCLLQLVLGTLLELVHKFWRCGLVYLFGVIAGSLAHSVSDPFVLLAGASGGCYALIGAHLASIIMNWKAMQDKWLDNPVNFLSSGVVRLILIILLGGGDTGLAIYARFKNPHASRVGFSAHLGGFVAGVLLGIPILRNLEVEKWEKVCFWVCIVLYTCFVAAAILFNGFCVQINRCPASIY
ncbi:rhomboid-related protein 1/2/3 [Paragonimus westermani]|uniref:Rhomboid-related protein 1/2/3 n=1 Tax=Paragonimus westermani TaxID=34504 RepID=A0A5J4P318_9TREM|nr:rhomboid-related protein 1/2/3 [Paragonimus westermani]